MQNSDTFLLEPDLINGTTDQEPGVGVSIEALLAYRREKAKERVAGSYAFFGACDGL